MFVESGYFLLYPTLLGIKVVNTVTNKVERIIGRQETAERFLGIALYQGRTVGSAALGTLQLNAAPDPTLFACAWKRHRFYLFTTRMPSKESEEGAGRDVFNEKPTKDELALNVAGNLFHHPPTHSPSPSLRRCRFTSDRLSEWRALTSLVSHCR